MADTPTSRTMKYLRGQGYIVHKVEHIAPKTFIRIDLFGFIDILAIKDGVLSAWQATSIGHIPDHLDKIYTHANYKHWMSTGLPLFVIGWKKYKKKVDGKSWQHRITKVE